MHSATELPSVANAPRSHADMALHLPAPSPIPSHPQRPPNYKVMLHNDNYNRREYVVQTLLKVVDVLTLDEAVNTMNEAHASGVALITMCAQHDAERYTEGLRTNGLTSSMEPSK